MVLVWVCVGGIQQIGEANLLCRGEGGRGKREERDSGMKRRRSHVTASRDFNVKIHLHHNPPSPPHANSQDDR